MSPGYDLCPSVSSVVPDFTLARTKASIEAAELSGIAARRMRPDRVSRYFARFRFGLAWFVPRSITSTAPSDKDLPGFYGIEKAVVGPERNFGLIDLHHALQRLAVGINHRSSELLRQQPSRLVRDAELGFELNCRHAIRVRRHEMRGPEPHRQRQLRPVHRRPGRDRRLPTAVKAFVGVRPALQQRCPCAATGGADKHLWPTPIEQERRATRLVRKARLKLAQRSRPSHSMSPPARRCRRRTAPSYYILTNLGQR